MPLSKQQTGVPEVQAFALSQRIVVFPRPSNTHGLAVPAVESPVEKTQPRGRKQHGSGDRQASWTQRTSPRVPTGSIPSGAAPPVPPPPVAGAPPALEV